MILGINAFRVKWFASWAKEGNKYFTSFVCQTFVGSVNIVLKQINIYQI